MADVLLPRYPVYVPSKGRWRTPFTARCLDRDGVPFRVVVEPQEADGYVRAVGAQRVLVLPFSNPGSVIPARNWIKDHATAEGHARHWQLDDNMMRFFRLWKGKRLPCKAGAALRIVEDFVDRYENVAIAGLEYTTFAMNVTTPFRLNSRVYSCSLLLNSLPYRWRGRYNEDTDICLQALADGWCTMLVTCFLVLKAGTMKIGGGNTASLYRGDGRLRMARSLERLWPGVIETRRRFQRPQHVVAAWQRFDNQLRLRPGVVVPEQKVDEHGLTLAQVAPVIVDDAIRQAKAEFDARRT